MVTRWVGVLRQVESLSMRGFEWFVVAILSAYGCATLAYVLWFSSQRRTIRIIALAVVSTIPCVMLVIPAERIQLRALFAFLAIDLVFKFIDLARGPADDQARVGPHRYLCLLAPFPILAIVHAKHRQRLINKDMIMPHLIRICVGIVGIITALLLLDRVSSIPIVRTNFAVNHLMMLILFVLAVESLSRVCWSLERMAGFDTRPIVQNSFASVTVLEFWRRHNHRVHDWLFTHIYPAAGGGKHPFRSVLLVFLFSGIFHEVMFALATSEWNGYQLIFFTVQGPASIGSWYLNRLTRRWGFVGRLIMHGSTLMFLAITSVWFFYGVSRVFPFIYASPSPLR